MIEYKYQDIFESDADVILHQVNPFGIMGAGIAFQIAKKYPSVYDDYKKCCAKSKFNYDIMRGRVLVSEIEDNPRRFIGNLFCQKNIDRRGVTTDYEALGKCLREVNKVFDNKYVAIPYHMSCGLAGGDWKTVFNIIEKMLVNCHVTIYEWGRNYDKCD